MQLEGGGRQPTRTAVNILLHVVLIANSENEQQKFVYFLNDVRKENDLKISCNKTQVTPVDIAVTSQNKVFSDRGVTPL